MDKYDLKSQYKTITGKLSDFQRESIKKLREHIRQDDDARANWKEKQVIAENQRMGVGRYTNVPYEGAPDIPLPETDKLIKKAVSGLVLSAWSPKKIVSVKPPVGADPQVVSQVVQIEDDFNAFMRSPEVNWYEKLCLAADIGKSTGHALFRVCKEFEATKVHQEIDLEELRTQGIDVDGLRTLPREEKEMFVAQQLGLIPDDDEDAEIISSIIDQFDKGNEVIEYDKSITESYPNCVIDTPTKVWVPKYTTDINTSSRITREEWWSRRDLEDAMDRGIFRKKDLDVLLSDTVNKDDDDIVEQQKARNEGISDSGESDLYRVEVVNAYYKAKDKDKEQRWIFVFLADINDPDDALLFSKPFPYDFKGWDYEKYNNEIKDSRYYSSRGIPEQCRAIQEIMERSVNNMIIRDEYNNMPLFSVLDTSEIADSPMAVAPGDKMIVQDHGEIQYINKANAVDISSERIMQYLKATVEEYIGVGDQMFRNATNKGGGKTLGEIEVGMQSLAPMKSLDVINWNNTLTRVYQKMFAIYLECKGIRLPFKLEVKSNGNLEQSDTHLATQKAYARLGAIGQLMQAGVADQTDMYNAAKDWLEKDGIKDPDLFITNPEEILQSRLAALQQQVMALQQQAEEINDANQKEIKQLARTGKKIEKEVSKFEGEMEVEGEEA